MCQRFRDYVLTKIRSIVCDRRIADLGRFNTICCFFDTKTRKHQFLDAATDRNYPPTLFNKHKIDLVVMEACGPSGWINEPAGSLEVKTLHSVAAAWDERTWCGAKDKDRTEELLSFARTGELQPRLHPEMQAR